MELHVIFSSAGINVVFAHVSLEPLLDRTPAKAIDKDTNPTKAPKALHLQPQRQHPGSRPIRSPPIRVSNSAVIARDPVDIPEATESLYNQIDIRDRDPLVAKGF